MLNRLSIQYGTSFSLVRDMAALSFLLALILLLSGIWFLRKPLRWWLSGAVLCLALAFALHWMAQPAFGPWPSIDDGPEEAARLRVTLKTPRRVGPFLFPAGAVLQYWREGHDELDWVDLPGPSPVMPRVFLAGHMAQMHAISGWTVHLAQDEPVSGVPCSNKTEVMLNPEDGHLMSCELTRPTSISGWLCTGVTFETDDKLRLCESDPEQINLPSGVYPPGANWELYDAKPSFAAVQAHQPLTLNDPAIKWVTQHSVEVDMLNGGSNIDRLRTTAEERVPLRGTELGGVIEWQYGSLGPGENRYSAKPLRAVTALRGQLSAPLHCARTDIPVGTQVEIPTKGNNVRRWPGNADWTSLIDTDATSVEGCALRD